MRRRGRGIQAKCGHHLAKLLHHAIAFDEQMGRQRVRRTPDTCGSALEKAGVPGQKDSALPPRLAEEVIVLAGKIHGIIPQESQPPGEATEHRIGQKPRSRAVLARRPGTTFHGFTLAYSPGFFDRYVEFSDHRPVGTFAAEGVDWAAVVRLREGEHEAIHEEFLEGLPRQWNVPADQFPEPADMVGYVLLDPFKVQFPKSGRRYQASQLRLDLPDPALRLLDFSDQDRWVFPIRDGV